ncbi:unnamed protein product [Ceutorhynchus assimilis]|uniref:Uncharacterized protein n=1 Tax=Ceutorhynchus assimilis TaxID=467358 RepID=A0A9N9MR81_9CUCU|nr:unnamed protein product [Ceutorhynchus assimilis]
MHFKQVTHVIFDMDGLIIDSEAAYHRILQSIAQQYGKDYSHELLLKILGTTEEDTARIFIKELNIPLTLEEFLKIFSKKTEEELQHPPLMPGAEKLIRHLANLNIPIAVATSSSEPSYLLKTKNHQNVFSLFSHVVCGSTDPEVINGKPAPDIFLVCASRFPDKPDPAKCLVLEDAPNGIRGALAAGMQGVLVPAKDVEEEQRSFATLVVDSLEEFQPELFGLPPFES